jgi:hypothetical protein
MLGTRCFTSFLGPLVLFNCVGRRLFATFFFGILCDDNSMMLFKNFIAPQHNLAKRKRD